MFLGKTPNDIHVCHSLVLNWRFFSRIVNLVSYTQPLNWSSINFNRKYTFCRDASRRDDDNVTVSQTTHLSEITLHIYLSTRVILIHIHPFQPQHWSMIVFLFFLFFISHSARIDFRLKYSHIIKYLFLIFTISHAYYKLYIYRACDDVKPQL